MTNRAESADRERSAEPVVVLPLPSRDVSTLVGALTASEKVVSMDTPVLNGLVKIQ